jgi:hypothetical protein
MKLRIRAFGLVLAAMLAMIAATAHVASAHEFYGEGGATQLTGKQLGEHVFKAEGNSVYCTAATFKGSLSGSEADEVQVHPTYGAAAEAGATCKFGFLNATVNTGSCDYRFDSDTDANGHATTKVVCTSGNITISLSGCTLTIGAQTVDQGVFFDNEGSGSSRDVKVTATATGIDYTASGFGCPLAGIKTGPHSDGTYEGDTTVWGDNVFIPTTQGIWVELN